ncbi:signal peptidase II [bacterium]|nr:MAG: signal peptidase II [bacterium]
MPLFLLAAVLSFAADQISKILIRSRLAEGEQLPFLPGFMHLEHVRNFGAAWGMMSGQKWLLVGFTGFVIAMILGSAREVARRGKLAAVGFGLIFGGAVGNLIDRILFGHVTDFFDLDTSISVLRTFPVFNVADSALTVGVIAMLLSLFFTRDEPKPETENPHS